MAERHAGTYRVNTRESEVDAMRDKSTKTIGWSALVALISLTVAAAGGARADVTNETLDALIDDALVVVDADAVTVETRTRLRDRLHAAIGVGALDDQTLVELGYVQTDNSVTPSTERDRDRVRERLQERLRDQVERWNIISPEWLQVMEQLREQLRTCREVPTVTCLEENRVQMQYRQAEQVEATYQQRVREANGDEEVLRELERERARAQLRVETMLQNGDAEKMNEAGVQSREMEQLRTRLEAHTQTQSQSTTSSAVASSSTQQERKGQP